MVLEPLIFVKTAKGIEEIATRAFRLPQRLRQVIIMADGERSTEELRQVAASSGDGDAILLQLEEEGFIARQDGALPVAVSAPAAAEPLAVVRAHLAEFARNLLGAEGDALLAQINACDDAGTLLVCVETCAELVHNTAGAAQAEAFRAMFRDLLGSPP